MASTTHYTTACLGLGTGDRNHGRMSRKPRKVAGATPLLIGEKTVLCVGTGYLAATLGRTSGTIRSWVRSGLFPKAPYVINLDHLGKRRWMYPAQFAESLRDLKSKIPLGARIERHEWYRWQAIFWGQLDEATAEDPGVSQGIAHEPPA